MGSLLPDVYLRFQGLKGECHDADHPGGEGWTQIQTFSFGFSMDDSHQAVTEDPVEEPAPTAPGETGNRRPRTQPQKKKKKVKRGDVEVKKNIDSMSTALTQKYCHGGERIPSVELHVCRSGGTDAAGAKDGAGGSKVKIPFLKMVFEDVIVKSVELDLFHEPLPVETIEFDYKRVSIQTIWTDNETGEAIEGGEQRVSWDFENSRGAQDATD